MSERVKRRKLNDLAEVVDGRDDSYVSASEDEKGSWNGFCEVESDPVCLSFSM
jgi:ubiquitin carboxyl-terminal hydrolase L5